MSLNVFARTGLALASALLLACGDAGSPTPEPEPTPTPVEPAPEPTTTPEPTPPPEPPEVDDPVARGEAQYQLLCASCHGPTGAGDGPVAAGLDPKPARHNDGTYMNPLTDEYLVQVITEGGAAVGKSPLMAPWGGALTPSDVRDVIAYIRSLADPPYSP